MKLRNETCCKDFFTYPIDCFGDYIPNFVKNNFEMNSWLESLESVVESSVLSQFDEIYYLNSKRVIDETRLDKLVSNQELKIFLSKEDSDDSYDMLDFFLLVNDESQAVLVLLSPFDLFTDESVFKMYTNIEEDLSSIPTIEVVK